ncbi:MAG: hypothetical protein L6R42_006946 [Xanthoria sp. 1 TBL-2021]|nr:MAG: hypothetical protein L6R42_006946 [Xanthoria sp. 1 TBL-2021]
MAEPSKKHERGLLAYRPLDQARREIRLVELRFKLPAASNGKQVPLLRMHQAFLNSKDPPKYIALSYTWDTSPKSIVLIEDEKRPAREVLVSANLADALYHLVWQFDPKHDGLKRFFKPSVKWIFWVDQLCINQNDNDEKSHQVKMMTDIFGQAKITIVWLGSREATLSHEGMEKYTQEIRHLADGIINVDMVNSELQSDNSILSQQLDRILRELCKNDCEQLYALTTFCTHPWFERAWVVQEVVASSKVTVHWEGGFCAWSDFGDLWFLLRLLSIRVREAKGYHPAVVRHLLSKATNTLTMTVTQSLDQPRTKPLINLIAHMLTSGKTRATQPEDLVHSMMDIASDGVTCGIEVDYAKHYTEVFRETALLVLKTLGARGLAWSGQRGRNSDPDGCRLPSWVPDLRLGAAITIHQFFQAGHPLPRLFSAAGNSRFEYTGDGESEILSIRTSYIDRVVEVSKSFAALAQELDSAGGCLLQSQAWLKDFGVFLDDAADRHPTRYDYSTRQEMHWRMPIADSYFDIKSLETGRTGSQRLVYGHTSPRGPLIRCCVQQYTGFVCTLQDKLRSLQRLGISVSATQKPS